MVTRKRPPHLKVEGHLRLIHQVVLVGVRTVIEDLLDVLSLHL